VLPVAPITWPFLTTSPGFTPLDSTSTSDKVYGCLALPKNRRDLQVLKSYSPSEVKSADAVRIR
jgi:hypothetical protein